MMSPYQWKEAVSQYHKMHGIQCKQSLCPVMKYLILQPENQSVYNS